MLASGARQHADTLVETQVTTPEKDHYPSDSRSGYIHVELLLPEATPESHPSALSQARESLSVSSTPRQLWFQLPGFSSTMLAAGFPAAPAETHIWSSLLSVSVVA